MEPLVRRSGAVVNAVLSDMRTPPAHPTAAAVLGALVAAHALGPGPYTTEAARALFAGVAAHAVGRLPSPSGAAVGLLLGHLAHVNGWPVPRGGSAAIADAMVADITAHGGTVRTSHEVTDLRELPRARVVLLDVAPRSFLRMAGGRLPGGYRRALERFRYGPGAAKADFLVSDPIPWQAPGVGRAGTVHLGGDHREVFRAETATARGRRTEAPFVLVTDPAATDPSRQVKGKRPVWAYAHVPHGDPRNPVDLIRRRIEQFAPGFTDTVIAGRGIPAAEMEEHNPNYVGGDIGAGAMSPWQTVMRPAAVPVPYRTPLRGVYLCSSSTPPGPGVHGMPGYLAALAALRREYGVRTPPRLSP